jgi:hypothetical protein
VTDYRKLMLEVIRGGQPDGLLFVPRLDIWYNRNKTRGTLPVGYQDLSLPEVATKLGLGFHSIVPDFIRSAPAEDLYHRGLGFYNNPEFPYYVDFSDVDFEVTLSENQLKVVYQTSGGQITTRCNYGSHLLASGSSIPDMLEHPVKRGEDYALLGEIFSKIRIRPTPERFQAYHDRVGLSGLAVAFLSLACGPLQHIMRDLRRYEDFCLDLYDDSELLNSCAEPLGVLYDGILDSALDSSAEVVLFGANYDETITFRPFFEQHIAPWLNRAAEGLHAAGKFLLTHTDGENQDLLPAFEQCSFDVADSICPAPMTKVSFEEYRKFFGARTTIWGGIPSSITLPGIMSESDFRDFVGGVIESARPYDHLILSIADTTPPDADFGRIQYIAEQCSRTWPSG